ncbi:hypothetical protein AB1Y20_020037 [Prymnesium parvum]|uniref:C-CAP/cofactor C-like domain-containing protein n=1 Tax=Prymnesium parvum TaxID=97485 RepID=A0AB34JWT3_PRYPA
MVDESASEMEQKKQAIIERMAAREREAEARKAARADGDAAAVGAQLRAFEASFAAELAAAHAALASLAAAASADPAAQLEAVGAQIESLHRLVAGAASFLPLAVRGTSAAKIGELEAALKAERERVAPKKKFSFKDRSKLGAGGGAPPPPPPPAEALVRTDTFKAPAGARGFRSSKGAVLTRPAGESVHGDYALEDLEQCDVRLLTACTALWVRNLRDCTVFTVPCPGSIYLTECHNCTLVLGARQIRMHTSTQCSLYLHAASHPIIEHCSDLRIAPYPALPAGIPSPWAAAGMNPEQNQWKLVDDFDWLKQSQSPNWRVMPDDDRLPVEELLKSLDLNDLPVAQ